MFGFKFSLNFFRAIKLNAKLAAICAAPAVAIVAAVVILHPALLHRLFTPASFQNAVVQPRSSQSSGIQTDGQPQAPATQDTETAQTPASSQTEASSAEQAIDASAPADSATQQQPKENIPQLARVADVLDGDTIVLDSGEHVRYVGINAPEIAHENSIAQCYGNEAADRNRELVQGRDVMLINGPDNTDIYGRLLRYVWVDGTLINQELIAEGYAYANDYGHPHQYDAMFADSQKQAQEGKLGLWSVCAQQSADKKQTAKKDTSPKGASKEKTKTPPPPVQLNNSLVINEVRPQGNEFVEVYNPADSATSLAGYYFAYYAHTKTDWAEPSRIKQFPDSATIPAHAYYLIAFGGTSFSSPKEDWVPYASDTLANSVGTVALFAGDPREVYPDGGRATRIDAFGWGDTQLFELAPMGLAPSGQAAGSDALQDGWTYARSADLAWLDHNNNSFDFHVTTAATPGKENILLDPRNDSLLQQPTAPAGDLSSQQTQNNAPVSAAQIVISEVLVNGKEFVELYNPTAQPQSLSGHYFAYFSSTKNSWNDPLSSKEFPDSASVPALGYFLIDVDGGNYPEAQWTPASFSNLSNTAGTVAIFSLDPKSAASSAAAQAGLVDAVGWGTVSLAKGTAAKTPGENQSLARDAANDDTGDNNADFAVADPTPDAPSSWQKQDNFSQQNTAPADAPLGTLSDVVINEVEVADNEFVELYNPADSAVDLSGYFFAYYSSSKNSWSDPYRLKQFPSGASIAGKKFYLIGLKGYATSGGNPNADWQPYTSAQLSDTQGTVAIFSQDPTAQQVYPDGGRAPCTILPTDAVGWGNDGNVALKETTTALTPPAGQSISRDETHDDTDDNASDFTTLSQPTPTNSGM